MFHSLRLRLLLVMILVMVVAVGTVALFASRATTTEFQRYVERGGMMRYRRFETTLAMYYDLRRSWDDVQPLVEQMGEITGERIVLADGAGKVIADSSGKLMGQAVGRNWAPPAAFITFRGVPVGSIYVNPTSRPGSDTGESSFIRAVNRSLLVAAGAAGLVAVLLTFALSRRILGPVGALTAAARRMEKGDLSQRVEVRTKDEIGELARAFNAMADGLARLEQLRRNLVSDVAHELRTPLSNIRGYLEAMRDGVAQPSEALIDSLHEETMRLNRLVDDLQELALAEAGQLKLVREPVALAEIIEKVVSVLQPQAASSGLTVKVNLPTDLPLVDADAERIAQVLHNLLNNAMTYTLPGGEITVTAKAIDAQVEVSVQDTGIGIAPEELPFIFERFYRVDKSRARATGGAGLGLAIVKQLVEAHGGRIWVKSTPGAGSTFTFTLPTPQQERRAIKSPG